jgi:hypothetical protein
VNAVVAMVPVIAFLLLLQIMDSFKLVKPASVLTAILTGGVVALLCLALHDWVVDASGLDLTLFSR